MKIPKISLIFAIVFLAVGLTFLLLPIIMIPQAQANWRASIGTPNFRPAYDNIQFWTNFQKTLFPFAILFLISATVCFIYTLLKWIARNFVQVKACAVSV